MHRGPLLAALAVAVGTVLLWSRHQHHRPVAMPGRSRFTCDSCTPPPAKARRQNGRAPRIPDGSRRPGIVLFYASQSREGKAALEALSSISRELQPRTAIVRVDADQYRQEAIRWRVRIVPTWILLSADGKERARHEGPASATELLQWLRTAGALPAR